MNKQIAKRIVENLNIDVRYKFITVVDVIDVSVIGRKAVIKFACTSNFTKRDMIRFFFYEIENPTQVTDNTKQYEIS